MSIRATQQRIKTAGGLNHTALPLIELMSSLMGEWVGGYTTRKSLTHGGYLQEFQLL